MSLGVNSRYRLGHGKHGSILHKRIVPVASAMLSLLFAGVVNANCATGIARGSPHPDFTLNFTPLDQVNGLHGMPTACMRTVSLLRDGTYGQADGFHQYKARTGQTPFLLQDSWFGNGATSWQIPQVVTDGTYDYYHMIIGEDGDSFQQEVYIRMGFAMNTAGEFRSHSDPDNSLITWAWATHTTEGHWGSASGGDTAVGWLTSTSKFINDESNAYYPLTAPEGRDDGNGSGNPNMVIMRQKMDSGGLQTEFLKDTFTKKPLIYQHINSTDIDQTVLMDMRNLTYDPYNSQSMADPQTFEITQNIAISDVLNDVWSYNNMFYKHNSESNATAGKYTYDEEGATGPGNSGGIYSYADGSFDIDSVDWSKYYDFAEDNPWTNQKPYTPVDYKPRLD